MIRIGVAEEMAFCKGVPKNGAVNTLPVMGFAQQ